VIDTSALNAIGLKRLLTGHFALDTRGLRVFVTSFAYRLGLPREADLVFDVRFLENPHYIDTLRGLTGCDPAVAAHIETDADFPRFFDGLWRLLQPLLPRYETSGKTYLTIADAPAVAIARFTSPSGWRCNCAMPGGGPSLRIVIFRHARQRLLTKQPRLARR
jgi:hypothetical protein